MANRVSRARNLNETSISSDPCRLRKPRYREFVLSEALTLAAFGRWSGEFTPLEPPIRSRPANIDVKHFEAGLAELTARRIGWLPSIDSVIVTLAHPGGSSHRNMDGSRHLLIQSDAAKFDLDHSQLPAICWRMKSLYWHTLWRQRQAGKLGDAHRIADRLLALAERLTRSYPDQAAAYMLLSEGYVQRAKNRLSRATGNPWTGGSEKPSRRRSRRRRLNPKTPRCTISSRIAAPAWTSWHRSRTACIRDRPVLAAHRAWPSSNGP